jgi:hypothetical protein
MRIFVALEQNQCQGDFSGGQTAIIIINLSLSHNFPDLEK